MSGLCECGCGEATNLARETSRRDGWVKGQPLRFIRGHKPARGPIGPDDYYIADKGHGSNCWVWRRRCASDGYAEVQINGFRTRAHRASYEQTYGLIPANFQLDHLCRVRNCVNPLHLEVVTARENIRRGSRARLTSADRQAIQRDSRSCAKIAADYGVSPMTIWQAKREPV